jgi:hypothetical protein
MYGLPGEGSSSFCRFATFSLSAEMSVVVVVVGGGAETAVAMVGRKQSIFKFHCLRGR